MNATQSTKTSMVKQAMQELKAYRETPQSDNLGLIHRMKHIEKLCVIHKLTQTEVQTLLDEVFGREL